MSMSSLSAVRLLSAGVAALAIGALSIGACGARTGLDPYPPAPPVPQCLVDADCRGYGNLCNPVACEPYPADAGIEHGGRCVALTPVDCDDGDACTTDTCDPKTGVCSHAFATPDKDGDGYRAPLPGYAAGAPGSCGNDCNDNDPNVHPGALEICNGIDDNCNTLVDEGFTYDLLSTNDVRVDGDRAPADPAGFGWSGTSFAASYTGAGDDGGFDIFLSLLDQTGDKITPPGEEQITLDNADASGGEIAWIGDRYGMTWQDRRTGSYEIYVSLVSAGGTKGIADTRLTYTQGFSVNPTIAWSGTEFLVAWQDDRDGVAFNLYGQRVAADGAVVGGNIPMTTTGENGFGSESPSLAVGVKGVGVASNYGNALTHIIQFQVYSLDLTTALTQAVDLTDGTTSPVFPMIVWNRDRYIVAWYDTMAVPSAIYATTVGEDGTVITPVTAITDPGQFHSRYPYLWAMGDRFFLAYSDDRDQNDGYEIYARVVEEDLTPGGPEIRVTYAPQDSLTPMTQFGGMGGPALLFRDDREDGAHHIFYTRMGCSKLP
jgi:hypothetical protein